ncbi:MAG: phosphate starvation-inducible protein PhoH [Candidatus Hydrogenedens sp.]|nr:phosphate starvation-inducible protein PhoH [Candidatus Hydrogenedens sp.]
MGQNGELRKRIQDEAHVRIVDRGAKVVVIGEEKQARRAEWVLREMLEVVRKGHTPSTDEIDYALRESRASVGESASTKPEEYTPLSGFMGSTAAAIRKDIHIHPRTHGQKGYLDALHENELVLAIGPAGTGKTYLAMAAAVSALLSKRVQRIILTRPAVEAGEHLGFLPGDLVEKVNPYLRPLYDALYSMVDLERVQRYIETQRIEVAPLAFMRGRTLDNAFVILDEAQNTTREQMLMFLTRLGQGSQAVVTGDITQVDLPRNVPSGLREAERILDGVEGVSIVHLERRDIVRNPLVQRIIEAYDEHREGGAPERPAVPRILEPEHEPHEGTA